MQKALVASLFDDDEENVELMELPGKRRCHANEMHLPKKEKIIQEPKQDIPPVKKEEKKEIEELAPIRSEIIHTPPESPQPTITRSSYTCSLTDLCFYMLTYIIRHHPNDPHILSWTPLPSSIFRLFISHLHQQKSLSPSILSWLSTHSLHSSSIISMERNGMKPIAMSLIGSMHHISHLSFTRCPNLDTHAWKCLSPLVLSSFSVSHCSMDNDALRLLVEGPLKESTHLSFSDVSISLSPLLSLSHVQVLSLVRTDTEKSEFVSFLPSLIQFTCLQAKRTDEPLDGVVAWMHACPRLTVCTLDVDWVMSMKDRCLDWKCKAMRTFVRSGETASLGVEWKEDAFWNGLLAQYRGSLG